jgi:adenosylcobinamide kinase/adenosylcobinamide-phosphate guanylyltransferase
MTPPDAQRRILVTGGVRSGKSAYAEGRLVDQPAVTYVAPGPVADPAADPEWAARITRHQLQRPAHWTTLETTDLAAVLRAAPPVIMIDCLGTWLTATIDAMGTWDQPLEHWRDTFDRRVADLVDAWREFDGLAVAVTNEVGWGLVSEHRSGRVFTDLLGRVNQRLAAASDELILMVAGRALAL